MTAEVLRGFGFTSSCLKVEWRGNIGTVIGDDMGICQWNLIPHCTLNTSDVMSLSVRASG